MDNADVTPFPSHCGHCEGVKATEAISQPNSLGDRGSPRRLRLLAMFDIGSPFQPAAALAAGTASRGASAEKPAFGRVKENVLPLPLLLSTQMFPP